MTPLWIPAIISMLVSPALIAAEQCDKNTTFIGAQYEFSQTRTGNIPKPKHILNLWRLENQVAHERIDTGITDLWQQLSNGRVRLIRYFDVEQHAIEYQADEIKYRNVDEHWQKLQHMVTNNLLTKMTVIAQSGYGCDRLETYQLTTDKQILTIKWMPEYQLIKSSLTVSDDEEKRWQLISLTNDQQTIEQEFIRRDNYQSTDYADIGDNESNPFLIKMINLGHISHGTSGFYDADGHDIGSEHGHH